VVLSISKFRLTFLLVARSCTRYIRHVQVLQVIFVCVHRCSINVIVTEHPHSLNININILKSIWCLPLIGGGLYSDSVVFAVLQFITRYSDSMNIIYSDSMNIIYSDSMNIICRKKSQMVNCRSFADICNGPWLISQMIMDILLFM
jgi:hypothetical protein